MKRTIFIGQAMPRVKRDPHDWPSLNLWLYSIGITDEEIRNNFLYSALIDYFPGSYNGTHRIPTHYEIEKERPRLINMIINFKPEVVVPIGKLSISYCLGKRFELLNHVLGKKYFIDPYRALNAKLTVIPLPHPSGASTWRYKKENQDLLLKALKLLKSELFKYNVY